MACLTVRCCPFDPEPGLSPRSTLGQLWPRTPAHRSGLLLRSWALSLKGWRGCAQRVAVEPGSGPGPRLRADPHPPGSSPLTTVTRLTAFLEAWCRQRGLVQDAAGTGPGVDHAFGSSPPCVVRPFICCCVVSAEMGRAPRLAAGPRPSSHQLEGVIVALGLRVSGFKDAGAAASAQPSIFWVPRPRRRGSARRRGPSSPALCWPRRWAFGDEGMSCDSVR